MEFKHLTQEEFIRDMYNMFVMLEEENRKMREVLEFYAKREHWFFGSAIDKYLDFADTFQPPYGFDAKDTYGGTPALLVLQGKNITLSTTTARMTDGDSKRRKS